MEGPFLCSEGVVHLCYFLGWNDSEPGRVDQEADSAAAVTGGGAQVMSGGVPHPQTADGTGLSRLGHFSGI